MTRKGFATALGLKLGAIALGLALLGLPGAVIFEGSYPIIRLVFREEPRIAPDSAWPIAIYITVLWPAAFLPLAWLASRLFPGERGGARVAFVVGLLAVWGVALSLVFYAMARQP
jgi:hypothetical protein